MDTRIERGYVMPKFARMKSPCNFISKPRNVHNTHGLITLDNVRFLVNNVEIANVMFFSLYEDYVTFVTTLDFEKVRKICEVLNKMGEVCASCFNDNVRTFLKIVPKTFVQITRTTYHRLEDRTVRRKFIVINPYRERHR